MATLDNANPVVKATSSTVKRFDIFADDDWSDYSDEARIASDEDDVDAIEDIDAQEVYDLIKNINDPEHPLTLEQLSVVNCDHITVKHGPRPSILIEFTPTVSNRLST